tara:strand:- start:6026 stop:6274 length:249 start_codon:yes stop_codon:yes gene_type:complete
MKIPKLQSRIRIEWLDPAGFISAPLEEAVPAPCWTEGVLVRNEPDYLVVATSQYSGSDIGDYTVVVKGCIKRITSTNQKVSG